MANPAMGGHRRAEVIVAERGMNAKQHAEHRKTLKRNLRGEQVPGDRGIQLQETRAFQRHQGQVEGVQDADPPEDRRGLNREEHRLHRKHRGQQRNT